MSRASSPARRSRRALGVHPVRSGGRRHRPVAPTERRRAPGAAGRGCSAPARGPPLLSSRGLDAAEQTAGRAMASPLRAGGAGFPADASVAGRRGGPRLQDLRGPGPCGLPGGLAAAAAEGGACSDDWRCARARALGGEGVGRRGGRGALTSRARHARGLSRRLHRAAEGSRPRWGTPGSALGRSRLCSRPREAHFDGSRSPPAGGQ